MLFMLAMWCRVRALKSLCELRGDKEDFRDLMDTVLKPKRSKEASNQKTRHKALPDISSVYRSIGDFRREPIGE